MYTQAASKTRKKRGMGARIEETKRNSITTYLPTRGDRDPPFQRFFSKTLALRANSSPPLRNLSLELHQPPLVKPEKERGGINRRKARYLYRISSKTG